MAAQQGLAERRTVYRCSSSISNFQEKIHARLGLDVWDWWKNRNDQVIFFGLYHWKDYIRFIWHRGQKKVFWCGSDILALEKRPIWRWLVIKQKYLDYCENSVEAIKLLEFGRHSEIRPMIFDDPNKFEVSYKHSKSPELFMSYHVGRGKEYGLTENPRVVAFSNLSEQDFNYIINNYQGAYRPNKFDGFSETLAKSVLTGQYPISQIRYPHIACLQDITLEQHLETLKTKTEPNIKGREYWLRVFEESLNEVTHNWKW